MRIETLHVGYLGTARVVAPDRSGAVPGAPA